MLKNDQTLWNHYVTEVKPQIIKEAQKKHNADELRANMAIFRVKGLDNKYKLKHRTPRSYAQEALAIQRLQQKKDKL